MSERLPDNQEYDVWIVWKLIGDRPVLAAIDTSPERAEKHVEYVRLEAHYKGEPVPETFVEQSRLNHLYGQSVTDLASFKVSSILAKYK